jgi:peroxiredoxin
VSDRPVEGPRGSGGLSLLVYAGLGLAIGLGIGALVFFQPQLLPEQGNVITQPTAPSAPAAVVGAPAPDFALVDLDGKAVKLSDYRGRAVLVNFWATWCGPCEAEMPLLQDRYTTYHGSGLEILAVNIGEDEATIRPYVEDLGLDFAIVLDPELAVNDDYRVLGYPTTITIDRDGNVVDVHVGAWLDEQLDAVLSQLGFGG